MTISWSTTRILIIKPPVIPQPIALALENALFKVTPVNGCLLFGQLADDFVKVERGFLFLTFGLFAYLPTLPDPYAADLGFLKFQFRGDRTNLAGCHPVRRAVHLDVAGVRGAAGSQGWKRTTK